MWLESWATALRASSWGWSLLAPCWQSQSSSVVAVLTQAGLCSPVQAGYKRLKAACVCALNSPTPRQGQRAPGKQHQSALLHREGSTLGESWLSSMCQDSISTPTQVSRAPGALWPFQCLWWTGLSQDEHEGCLWAPAAIVQKICWFVSLPHMPIMCPCERDLQGQGILLNPCSLHSKTAPKFSGPLGAGAGTLKFIPIL